MLRDNDKSAWDVSALEKKISQILAGLGNGSVSAEQAPTPVKATTPSVAVVPQVDEVDHTNYDLLQELMSELPQDVLAEYEKVGVPAGASATPELKVVSEVVAVKSAPLAEAKKESLSASPTKAAGKVHVNQIIKVDTTRVDNVLNAVGELVVLKNQIVQNEIVRDGNNSELAAIVDQIDKAVRELYDKTLSIRMTPLKSLFLKRKTIKNHLTKTK